MKFQETTQHTIRFLTYMAKEPHKLYATKQVAEELSIPYKYITKIVTLLSKEGFIQSKKGSNGGISLLKDPQEITVRDILEVLNDLDLEMCVLGNGKCSHNGVCAMHHSWMPTRNKLEETFNTTTLAILAQND